jgi:hypothetical protein
MMLPMTASSDRSKLVLLQAAARPTAAPMAGPQAGKVRRYRLARAHLQSQRTQSLAVATEAIQRRTHA